MKSLGQKQYAHSMRLMYTVSLAWRVPEAPPQYAADYQSLVVHLLHALDKVLGHATWQVPCCACAGPWCKAKTKPGRAILAATAGNCRHAAGGCANHAVTWAAYHGVIGLKQINCVRCWSVVFMHCECLVEWAQKDSVAV